MYLRWGLRRAWHDGLETCTSLPIFWLTELVLLLLLHIVPIRTGMYVWVDPYTPKGWPRQDDQSLAPACLWHLWLVWMARWIHTCIRTSNRTDIHPRQGVDLHWMDGGPVSTKCQLVPSFHLGCDAAPLSRMIDTPVHAVRPLHRGQMQSPGPACPRSLAAAWRRHGREGDHDMCLLLYRSARSPVGASRYGVEAMRKPAAPVVVVAY